MRFVDEWEGAGPAADAALPLRAPHLPQRVLRRAARHAPGRRSRSAVAERLVARHGAEPCDCAADIALLFETARDNVRAAEYWNRAAQAAARLYAHDETERLAQRGLALLAERAAPARRARPSSSSCR